MIYTSFYSYNAIEQCYKKKSMISLKMGSILMEKGMLFRHPPVVPPSILTTLHTGPVPTPVPHCPFPTMSSAGLLSIASNRRSRATPHQTTLIKRHFQYSGSTAKCITCGLSRASNVTRQFDHIMACTQPVHNIITELRRSTATTTTLSPLQGISRDAHKKRLTEKCCKAVFYGGKPLNYYDKAFNPYGYSAMKDLAIMADLSDWSPPSRSSIDSHMKEFYDKRYEMAQLQIKPQSYIGFTADESADAANRRVLNVSAISPHFGPVFICNLDMEDTRYILHDTMRSSFLANLVIDPPLRISLRW